MTLRQRGIRRALAAAAMLAAAHARATTLDLMADCHAVGDGRQDDAAALKLCLVRLQQSPPAQPAALHVPAGIFRITGIAGAMPVLDRNVTITGDGPHASTLLLAPDFTGDLLAWDESWVADSASGDQIDPRRDTSGPTITGLRITGTRTATPRQNAIVFYDRNDHVLLRDIEVDDINGSCLSIGTAKHMPEAYIRESTIENLKCFATGPRNAPAIQISSTARPGSDATNELDIYKLAVFDAPAQGVAITNPQRGSATRGIRVYGLRVEKTGGDGLQIGAPTDRGQVAGITIFDLTVIAAQGAALRIAAAPGAPSPYNIRVQGGALGPGNRLAVAIDSGRLIDLDLDHIDAPVLLGPGAGTNITINSNGAQSLWRVLGAKPPGSVAQPLELRSPFTLRGLPQSGDRVGAAALQADLPGGATARLTMDGAAPDAYNCINPAYGQSFLLDIRLLAQDRTDPRRAVLWTMPAALLTAWYGPRSARFMPGATTLAGAGGQISAGADQADGCLSLAFTAPPPASHQWAATALVTFARSP